MDLGAARGMSEAEAAEEVDVLFRLGVRLDVIQKHLPELESFCYDSGAAAAVCRWVDENDGNLNRFFDEATLTVFEGGDPSDIIRGLVEGVSDAVWQTRTHCTTSATADDLQAVLESVEPGSKGSIGEGTSKRDVWVAPSGSSDEIVGFIDAVIRGLENPPGVAWAHAGALESVGLAAEAPELFVRRGVEQREEAGSMVDFCRYGLRFSSAEAVRVAVSHAERNTTPTKMCAIMLCGCMEDAVGVDDCWLDLSQSRVGSGTGAHRFDPPPDRNPCAQWYSLVLRNRFPGAPIDKLTLKMESMGLSLQTDVMELADKAVVIYGAQASGLNKVDNVKVRALEGAVTDQLVVKGDFKGDASLISTTKSFQVAFIVWRSTDAHDEHER